MPPRTARRSRAARRHDRLNCLNQNLAGKKTDGDTLQAIRDEAIRRVDSKDMIHALPGDLAAIGVEVDLDMVAVVTAVIAHRISDHRHDVRARKSRRKEE